MKNIKYQCFTCTYIVDNIDISAMVAAQKVPAGGAAALAPEGGALEGPSALAPTSSWVALVAL
jgi:hypothetical protein